MTIDEIILNDTVSYCLMLQPDRGATVPKFGDWDESDPSSSENYTNIFTRVRVERQTEDGSLPAGTNVSSIRSRSSAENSKVRHG